MWILPLIIMSILPTIRSFHLPKRVFSIRGIEERMYQSMKSSGEKKIRKTIPQYVPATPNQKTYVESLGKYSLVFGIGPAGCGKTLFACKEAIHELQNGKVNRIVFTRPVVSVEEELGFLPGDIQRKMDPWMQPMFDIFLEYYTQPQLDEMISNGVIEISPLGFMRGRTFKRACIIADEMQNSSPNQMLMLLTRLGDNSRMIVLGDLNQSDIRNGKNGLADFYEKYKNVNNVLDDIKMVFMDETDVQRSPIVKSILSVYDGKPNIQTIDISKESLEQESKNICNKYPVNDVDKDIGAVPSSYESENDAAMIPKSQMSSKYNGL